MLDWLEWPPFGVAEPLSLIEDEDARLIAALEDAVQSARKKGMPTEFVEILRALLMKFKDIFRITLGRDPPVDMPPLKIHLKPGAVPVKCKARRYSLPQREFMQSHVDELEAAGYIYRNCRSRWASPPLIVKKYQVPDPEGNKPHQDEFRMTIDLRGINGLAEAMV